MVPDKFYLEDFYKLAKDFVQYYPQNSLRCQSLHTFAVLESFSDLNTPNLGKTLRDRNKPFFFSREWASTNHNPSKIEYDYPGMFLFDQNLTVSDPFDKSSTICYKIELVVLDKYERDCEKKNCVGCADRTRNEIFIDTEAFLQTFINYLKGVLYVEGRWVHKNIYQLQGGSESPDDRVTRGFIKMLKQYNTSLAGIRWSGSSDDLHGTLLELIICSERCSYDEYQPHLKEFKVGQDQGCC